VRQPGARRKEACPGQYLPSGAGQRASSPAAGGLHAAGSLPGNEGSHDGELPSHRTAPWGRNWVLAPGTPAPLRTPEVDAEHAGPSRLSQHLRGQPSPARGLQQPGDPRGGRGSAGVAEPGAGLGVTLTGTVLQAATSGQLFLAPRDRGGHAVGGRLRDSQELRAISGSGC